MPHPSILLPWFAKPRAPSQSYYPVGESMLERYKFRRRAGISPLQYREKHRFELASYLLANALHHSCQDIAFVLGYTNPDRFSEQFKKRFGVSPLEYRKQHSNKNK